MIATDSVSFMARHPDLTISEKLGDWEEACHYGLTRIKPGFYDDHQHRRRNLER
jgi:hypothetical protein